MIRVRAAARHPVIFGTIFGVFVPAIMQLVVVPMGRAHLPHYTAGAFTNRLIAQVLFFGVPVAAVARRAAAL